VAVELENVTGIDDTTFVSNNVLPAAAAVTDAPKTSQRSKSGWMKMPPPPKPPWRYTILFVDANGDGIRNDQISLKEEYEMIQNSLWRVYGEAAVKPLLKLIPYSTWNEVMEVLMREYPTVVHFGCHSSQEEGLALIQRSVSAEDMIGNIEACNLLAFQKEKPGVRVIVLNACESNEHAQQLSTWILQLVTVATLMINQMRLGFQRVCMVASEKYTRYTVVFSWSL